VLLFEPSISNCRTKSAIMRSFYDATVRLRLQLGGKRTRSDDDWPKERARWPSSSMQASLMRRRKK